MIGGTCGKDTRHSTGKPCSGWSAKYNNAASEVIYSWTMDSGQSDECGTTEYGGSWFALFRNPDASTHDGPVGVGVILCVTSSGAVAATRFTTEMELEEDWAKLQAETDDSEEEEEDEEI